MAQPSMLYTDHLLVLPAKWHIRGDKPTCHSALTRRAYCLACFIAFRSGLALGMELGLELEEETG